jgi:hypothetical protein
MNQKIDRNEILARLYGNSMFKHVSDEEWESINQLNEGYPGIEILIKVQNDIIKWYEEDLVNQLRLAARGGKSVNTDIISGILEGANAISIENILHKASNRQKNRQRADNKDKQNAPISSVGTNRIGVRDLRI